MLFVSVQFATGNTPTIVIQQHLLSAVIGQNMSICIHGESDGTNGGNYWIVDEIHANTIDISEYSGENISNKVNPTNAICTQCSCHQEYFSVDAVSERIELELNNFGLAAFLVTTYNTDSLTEESARARLCYGVPNRFLSFLIINEIQGGERETNLTFHITSDMNKTKMASFKMNVGKNLYI